MQTVMPWAGERVSIVCTSEGTNHPRGPQDHEKPALLIKFSRPVQGHDSVYQ